MKRNRLIPLSIILSATVAFAACVSSEPASPALVVEGYIADGDYPVVCLMQTVSPDRQMSFADMVVRWGKVSLSDGDTEVLLTGGPDNSFFPPFTYNSYDIMGRHGKAYLLKAEYQGKTVTASTVIPDTMAIDSITSSPAGHDGQRRQLMLHITPKGDGIGYYRILARVKDQHERLLPGFMGIAEDGGKPGHMSIAVNRPKTAMDSVDYLPTFLPGETVEVALCTMERQAYEFWLDYENAVAFSGSQFLAPATPLRSNVANGYGYFFGYGITRRIICVE